MRVGWLIDDHGYTGGAEMTAAEFRAAAPDVEVVDCPPEGVVPGCDRYVVHNAVQYEPHELEALDAPVTKYAHDLFVHDFTGVRQWLADNARWIFCSPAQRKRMRKDYGVDGVCIPPALDLDSCKPPRQQRRNGTRAGTCSIAQWRYPGKGPGLVAEYARTQPVDVYGPGPCLPNGPGVTLCGELPQEQVAQTLWGYERFVFLPVEMEPFCRTAVEAHYAGCQVVVNGLIGARHYLEHNRAALETAAEDFWAEVLR